MTETSSTTPLSPFHTLKIGEESREIKMTFGLLSELAAQFNDVDDVATVTLNHGLRDYLVTLVLSERDKQGMITEPFSLWDSPMSIEEGESLLKWVVAHVFDFFLKSLEGTVELSETNQTRLTDLKSFVAGSMTSVSAMESAGPSTPPPAS